MANVDKFSLEVAFSNVSLAQVRSSCSKQFPIIWDVYSAKLIIQCYEENETEHSMQYQFSSLVPLQGKPCWSEKFKKASFPKKTWKRIEFKFESI